MYRTNIPIYIYYYVRSAKRDAILKLASRLGRASDAKTISELSAQLQQRIFDLLLHRVDVSVLQVSGILDVLKNLKGAANVTSDIVDLTAEVRKTWKNQVRIIVNHCECCEYYEFTNLLVIVFVDQDRPSHLNA